MRRLNFLLLVFGLFVVTGMSAQNLLLNGGFESWDDVNTPTNWTHVENTTRESVDTCVHGGMYSAMHVGGTKDLGQLIPGIVPGKSYELTIWYKVGIEGDGDDCRIWSKWATDGTYDNTTDADVLQGPASGYFDNNGGAWSSYTTTVTAPEGANEFYFEVRTYSGATVYWDDFSFVDLSAIDLTAIDNSSILKDTINDVDEGSTIVLKRGMTYDFSATALKKSVRIMSEEGDGAPAILDMGTSSLSIAADSALAFLILNDVEIKGDISAAYLMNSSNTGASIDKFILENVNIHNLRGVFRSKTGTNNFNLFKINNSVVDSIGGYGVMIMDNADAYCADVEISNSTFSSVGQLLRWKSTADVNSVVISNCTFEDTPNDGYIIRLDTDSVLNGVVISNSIFGKSNNKLKSTANSNSRVSVKAYDSYMTSDCTLKSSDFDSAPMAYSGSDADLFADVANKDYSIVDISFAGKYSAGDPRWRMSAPVLKHSYDFEDADTVIDKTGSVNGTLEGSATVAGGALVLDTDGDIATFDGVALDLNSYSAISMEYYYISKQGANDGHWNWTSYFGAADGSNNMMTALNVWNETRMKKDNSTQIAFPQIDDGRYHHVVAILTNSSMKMYRDGVLEGEAEVGAISIGTEAAYLGTAIWSDPSWLGSIYQFNIYEGELDAETVSAKADAYLASTYSYLSDLSVSTGELKPAFSVATTTYEVVIPKGTASVAISATPKYSGSTVKGAGDFAITADIDTAEVVVVAEDGSDSTTYMVIFQALDPISGTIIGHESSWGDDPATYITAAFDGDINTYVDAPTATGYVGYDFGEGKAAILTAFKYAPRSGHEGRMVGGEIRGANSADLSDAVTLYTITEEPAFEYTLVQLDNTDYYRYIYYYSADGYCNISELEMFGYIINTDCYTPLYPELENLTPDPEGTDVSLWGGWGLKSIVTGSEAYCGPTAILLEDPTGAGCKWPDGSAALDVSNFAWQPNTTYRLHVMVKTIDGPIGFLASGSIDGTGPDGSDFGFAFDTHGEWMLLDTMFTTSASPVANFFSFNTCDYNSTATKTYIDNYELYALPQVKPKVAYVTESKTMAATATQPGEDPIVTMLMADDNFEVDTFIIAVDSVVDFSGYDVVVGQEPFSSSSAIWKRGGTLGMGSLTVPHIINKVYAMKAGRGFETGTAGSGGEQASDFYLHVDAANQSDDLFKGLTFVGDSIRIFWAGYADDGSDDGTHFKGLQYATDVVFNPANSPLALSAMAPSNATVGINYLATGDSIGSEEMLAPMYTMCMNYGAICGNAGKNITGAGLTIWRNAVYMLAGLTVPEEAIVTSVKDVSKTEASISVYPSITSGMFTVEFANEPGLITVYNLSGRIIKQVNPGSSKERISIEGTGLYIIKAESAGESKLFKVVKTN